MRFHAAMLDGLGFREDNRPTTPTLVARRNDLVQTLQLIESRQREIELELRMLQAEQRNLQIAWDEANEEWNKVWMKGLP